MPARHPEPLKLLTAIDTLHTAGSTWRKSPEERAAMTMACHDSNNLPRVKDAGKSKVVNGVQVQVMHNGLMVKKDGYQGKWEAEIIRGLKGVHEPQEEKVFNETLKRIKEGGVIMELGSWWCYYSMWFLKSVKKSRAICCEPDSENIKLGKFNMDLNGFKQDEQVIFYRAAAGDRDKVHISFTEESGTQAKVQIRTVDSIIREHKLKRIDILHIDIQGAELKALRGAEESIKRGLIRFVFISTHHYAISGDPNLHQKCLDFIRRNGGSIITQHTILESCSGDGLIVASFSPSDKDFQVEVSRQLPNDSLFRSSEEDLAILWNSHNRILTHVNELITTQAEIESEYNQELDAKNSQITQLEAILNEITPLRRHIKRSIRHWLGAIVGLNTKR